LLAEGCLNQAIVQEIVASEKKGESTSAKEQRKRSHIIFYTLFFGLTLGSSVAHAQGTNKQSAMPGIRLGRPCGSPWTKPLGWR